MKKRSVTAQFAAALKAGSELKCRREYVEKAKERKRSDDSSKRRRRQKSRRMWRGLGGGEEGKGSFSNLESSDPLQVDSNPKHFGGGRLLLSSVPRLYCAVALRMLATSAVMILIPRELCS